MVHHLRRAALMALGTPALLSAQRLTILPMTAHYTVDGEFQGEAMPSWTADLVVRDTTIDGKKLLLVTRRTLRTAMNASFEQHAAIDTATGRVVSISGANNGQQVSNRYALRLAGGKITGSDAEGGTAITVNSTLAEDAVPDFALATVLAGRSLADGATIAFPVFTYSGETVRTYPFRGRVTAGTFSRPGSADPVPAWIVTGDAGYAAQVIIARGDGVPLQVRVPQGTLGTQTDRWTPASRP